MSGYRKAAGGVFDSLEGRLDEAKTNAARALDDAQTTNEFNPSTEVHRLVHYLQSLKTNDEVDAN